MKQLAIQTLKLFLSFTYGLLCFFLPRRNRIVCLSRQSNTEPIDFMLIREYFQKTGTGVECIVLAKTLDNPLCYFPHMFKQLYYIATSRAVLLDSYCIVVSLLADIICVPVIQLWHAMGNMKKFGYAALDEPEGRSSEAARLLNMHQGYSSILISSYSFIDDYAQGFGADPSIIFEAPLPKTDLLIDQRIIERNRSMILQQYPQLSQKKNIVYCPTFRRVRSRNEAAAMRNLLDAIDFTRYNLIYIKHPVSKQYFTDPRVLQDDSHYFNMLYIADYIISDYSSIIYEAGLLQKPIYLYAYDWEEYSSKRSLNIDIEHDVPTLFTDNPREIIEAIAHDEFDHDAYNKFTARNITIPRGETCTQRVCNHILGYIE